MNKYNDKISLFKNDNEILSILLSDKTSKKNIIWATNNYQDLGDKYKKEDYITLENCNIIKPRVTKSKAEQKQRIVDKAEVFTPSWVCNKQNNLVDKVWADQEMGFNEEIGERWETKPQNIFFPTKSNKTWQDYVLDTRLEIACGEAPYIVSRYDSVSGKKIDINNRIGILDRKMRVISENTTDESDWEYWTTQALQNVYGYEFQGDNVFLARENILTSIAEYYEKMFNKILNHEYLTKFAEIISWNIWQMDGITYTIPSKKDFECNIMDWQENKPIKFTSLLYKG